MSADVAPLAVIRPDRHLEILDPAHRPAWTTAPDPTLVWGPHTMVDRGMYAWPTWSPDGTRIATFRTPRGRTGAELVLLHDGGVRADVLLYFYQRIPIYAQWSPDGATLAALYQDGDQLGLCAVDPHSGDELPLVHGSPLFFTWADANHVAVFVAERARDAEIGLLDARTREFDPFPGRPGNFCAPVVVDGRVAYVAHRAGRLGLWVADREAARDIEEVSGLVAILPDPRGGRVARALAPDDRSPYRNLALVDTATGEVTPVDDGPCTAFLWSPTGEHLVVARSQPSGAVRFHSLRLLDGLDVPLGEVRPTRDLRFYLRYFEQFAQSHPLLDPAGRALVVPGELDRAGNTAGLWRLPLDGAPPERLGDGLLGVWGPAR